MRKQRGGNDTADVKIPDLPVPKAQFTDSALVDIPEVTADVLSGGAKKKAAAAKKSPAGKKADAKKSPVGKKAKGGALVEEIKGLAVPFAILLAKQGLDGMFNKKTEKKAASASAKRSVKSAKGGSGCSSCAKVAGGAPKNRYAQLSAEIDKFLSNY